MHAHGECKDSDQQVEKPCRRGLANGEGEEGGSTTLWEPEVHMRSAMWVSKMYTMSARTQAGRAVGAKAYVEEVVVRPSGLNVEGVLVSPCRVSVTLRLIQRLSNARGGGCSR